VIARLEKFLFKLGLEPSTPFEKLWRINPPSFPEKGVRLKT
jgi:hypothetical protein